MHCLYGGYNLHRFSDALGLVYTACVKMNLFYEVHTIKELKAQTSISSVSIL